MNKYNAQIGAGGTQYAYYHEEDESSFQLVSSNRDMSDKPSIRINLGNIEHLTPFEMIFVPFIG